MALVPFFLQALKDFQAMLVDSPSLEDRLWTFMCERTNTPFQIAKLRFGARIGILH